MKNMVRIVDKLRKTTFAPRMILVFLINIIITYILLWLALKFGTYVLFFAGAIAGGMWGAFWGELTGEDNPVKTWLFKSPIRYYIIEIVLILVLILLAIFYPLPQ